MVGCDWVLRLHLVLWGEGGPLALILGAFAAWDGGFRLPTFCVVSFGLVDEGMGGVHVEG